jgi:leukotriene-A4 hydrolase
LQEIRDVSPSLSAERSRLLGKIYKLSSSKNVELKTVYYLISMESGDRSEFPGVVDLVGSVGRMKFVRPLYRKLYAIDKDLAVETFKKNINFYGSTSRSQLQKDLGLR